MTIVKLAARLAYSRDIRQRWRQISVIAAGFVSTLLVLLSAGVVYAAHGSDARIQLRSPLWATSEQDAHLAVSLRATFVGIYQFPVVWLQPAAGHGSYSGTC